jgi:hypothetical protein
MLSSSEQPSTSPIPLSVLRQQARKRTATSQRSLISFPLGFGDQVRNSSNVALTSPLRFHITKRTSNGEFSSFSILPQGVANTVLGALLFRSRLVCFWSPHPFKPPFLASRIQA